MLESTIEWSIDNEEELVAHIGGEVIHRVAPGSRAWQVKHGYMTTLRARFEDDRRAGPDDRRVWIRDDGSGRRKHDQKW